MIRRSIIVGLVIIVTLIVSNLAFHPFVRSILDVSLLSAKQLQKVQNHQTPFILIDIRSLEEYTKETIPSAVSVPYDQLHYYSASSLSIPITVFCQHGEQSLFAAKILSDLGFAYVTSLRGGMESWKSNGFPVASQPSTDTTAPKTKIVPISVFAQTVSVASGLVIKPIYMLLCLLFVIIIRNVKGEDISLLRKGLVLFFVGEALCAIDFLFAGGKSYPLELVHALGMVGMGTFLTWGLMNFVDNRMLHFTDLESRCTVRGFCTKCTKTSSYSCPVIQLFKIITAAFVVISAIPLTAPLLNRHTVSPVFSSNILFSYGLENQITDFRIMPVIAMILFGVTFLILTLSRTNGVNKSKPFFFSAMGFMGFSLFRFFLHESFRRAPVWADFWEETTELIAILGIGIFLFVMRHRLGIFSRYTPPKTPQ